MADASDQWNVERYRCRRCHRTPARVRTPCICSPPRPLIYPV